MDSFDLGVDIIFFDAEDQGVPKGREQEDPQNRSWCIGSRYWAHLPHQPNYQAEYGILLDMVGAQNAVFYREGMSAQSAPELQRRVWAIARALGSTSFRDSLSVSVIDDHLPIINALHIPMLDIVELNAKKPHFGAYHHTHLDNLGIIDKETLQQVGRVVLQVVVLENQRAKE
ncbi:hypothetical protein GCM10023185_18730 [Hymenobacter saemangeumensis]|uniref:Peptidase M28 domain-containing protein n=2 Tax=Hymenobacter saemangeumensis TaxID=1084522 RepID=A0ABP8ICC3_9BACT